MADQKLSADSIPEGWTVEIKERKYGRRDKHYTDPKNGYVFRSIKAVKRYLEMGEPGGLAIKSKCKDSEMGLEDMNVLLPVPAVEQKLEENVTNKPITKSHNLKLVGVAKDEQSVGSTLAGDSLPLPEHTSDQCMDGAAVLEDEAKLLENKKIKRGLNKLHDEKTPDSHRRASKRLAGINANPEEIKDHYRVRRVTRTPSDKVKSSKSEISGSSNPPQPQECAETKPEHTLLSSPDNLLVPDENVTISGSPLNLTSKEDTRTEFAKTTHTDDVIPAPRDDEVKLEESHPEPYTELPFWEYFGTDPCIEFAVKTLTGEIPVMEDLDLRDYFQHQIRSSCNEEGDKDLLNGASSGFLSQNNFSIEPPSRQQQDLTMPTLPNNGNNPGLQASGDTSLHDVDRGKWEFFR